MTPSLQWSDDNSRGITDIFNHLSLPTSVVLPNSCRSLKCSCTGYSRDPARAHPSLAVRVRADPLPLRAILLHRQRRRIINNWIEPCSLFALLLAPGDVVCRHLSHICSFGLDVGTDAELAALLAVRHHSHVHIAFVRKPQHIISPVLARAGVDFGAAYP
ncbi:hypothetical protein FB451DRAFT_1562003 [Mycena latifolia]|nr:hypothetical protein FB451DRAFT_1562003 [Mycena latifolia]